MTLRQLATDINNYLSNKRMKVDRATITMALFDLGYDMHRFSERRMRNLSKAIKNINKYKLNA